jgi:hypothetical protein
VLGYYFILRWNSPDLVGEVAEALAWFGVPPEPEENRNPPTPGLPRVYSLVDLGAGEPVRYRFLFNGVQMLGSDESHEVVTHLLWHVNSEMIRHTGSYLLVHAGAVADPRGYGVLLPGRSGSGKSTLVAGLVREGFGYLSDEAGAIDPIRRDIYPYPKALTLKSEVVSSLIPDARPPTGSWTDGRPWHLRPERIRPGAIADPCPIRLVVAPKYEPGAPTVLTPISRGRLVVELGTNLLNRGFYGRRALPLLADIALSAPGYLLTSGDLSAAVGAVADLARSV